MGGHCITVTLKECGDDEAYFIVNNKGFGCNEPDGKHTPIRAYRFNPRSFTSENMQELMDVSGEEWGDFVKFLWKRENNFAERLGMQYEEGEDSITQKMHSLKHIKMFQDVSNCTFFSYNFVYSVYRLQLPQRIDCNKTNSI